MDNIAKLVLGMLALVGLIILMIPQGNPLTDKGAQAAVTVPAPEDIPDEVPPNDPVVATAPNANVPVQDVNAFGQPMMDPTPPGQRQAQQQQQQPGQPQQMANEGNGVNPEMVAPYPANPSLGAPAYGPQAGYQVGPIPTGG
jgi:hypothetical protein